MFDKNGKEIKTGNLIVYTNWLSTVVEVVDDNNLLITVDGLRHIVLQVSIKDDQKKIEVVTEQEAIIFLLKRGASDFR